MRDDYLILPDLVVEAEKFAAENDFRNSCTRRTGSLLQVLAAAAESRVLEIGSGYGVGSAWLASAMREECRLVTVELNAQQQAAVASLLRGNGKVTSLLGDWRRALEHGPFDLAFVDVGEAKDDGADDVIAAVKVGGTVLLDDFTPGPLFDGEHDARWHRWMRHPRLACTEVLTGEGAAALLAVRTV